MSIFISKIIVNPRPLPLLKQEINAFYYLKSKQSIMYPRGYVRYKLKCGYSQLQRPSSY